MNENSLNYLMPNNNPAKLAKLRMPDYSGSWWQVRPSNLTTLPIGKWTPIGIFDIPANSLVKMRPEMRYESLPLVAPLYGGWTQRTKYYFVPYRLYIPELRKNLQQDWNSIPSINLPRLTYNTIPKVNSDDEGDAHFGVAVSLAGSLLDRLHMCYGEMYGFNSFNREQFAAPKGSSGRTLRANMLPLLAYIDAWMYGEYNPQDKNIPVDYDSINIGGNPGYYRRRSVYTKWVNADDLKQFAPSFGFGNSPLYNNNPNVNSYGLKSSYSLAMRANNFTTTAIEAIGGTYQTQLIPNYPIFTQVYTSAESTYDEDAYARMFADNWDIFRNTTSTVGLLPVTYKGDYFTSWFNTDAIAKAQSYVVTVGQSLLNLRKKNQDMLISLMSMVSGNRYVDYLQYMFDTELELKDHPILIGYDEIDFGSIDVLSNADTSGANPSIGDNSVLAATASKVRNYNEKVKPFSVKTKEPGLILVCTAIVPNIFYYQGSPRFQFYDTMADLWKPQYQKQGFQQMFRGEFINPFAMSNVDSASDWSVDIDGDGFYLSPTSMNMEAVCWVPLGWEHMKRYKWLSGGMKTAAFKPWSLHRDYLNLYEVDYEEVGSSFVGLPTNSYDPFVDSNVDLIKSTYVDAGAYNYMFTNVSRADQTNFVVQFDFDMSIYQPLVHVLVDKQGL